MIHQEIIQPVTVKQPILKKQVIEQPIIQPTLTETYQSAQPEMIQQEQQNAPITNQPMVCHAHIVSISTT